MSNAGTWFQNIAQVLLIYRLTESTFLVGVVNFAQFAAIIFLVGVAGRAADRFDRRKLLIITQLSAVAITAMLAALTQADLTTAPVLIAFAFTLGITTAFATPALQALIPSLVEREELPAAIALTAVTFNLSRALGPVLGVLVVSTWGIPAAFAINSISYLVLIAALLMLSPRAGETRHLDAAPKESAFRLVRADMLLAFPIVVVGLVSLGADPVNTLTPAFSTEILGRPDTYAGYLVGAFGGGAVSAAFVAPRWNPTIKVLSTTLGLLVGGIVAFAFSSDPLPAFISLAVAGFGYLASVTLATSLLQLRTADRNRGRVMALWSVSFHGVRPFGSLVDGAVASAVGLRAAAIAMAVPALIGALAAPFLSRRRSRTSPSGP
jgi:MFS family permease